MNPIGELIITAVLLVAVGALFWHAFVVWRRNEQDWS